MAKKKLALSMRDKSSIVASAIAQLSEGSSLGASERTVVVDVLEQYLSRVEAIAERARVLSEKIAGLRFGTDALKELLLIQCDRLTIVQGDEAQDKILDTLLSALKSKAPDPPPPPKSANAVSIGDYTSTDGSKYSDVEI